MHVTTTQKKGLRAARGELIIAKAALGRYMGMLDLIEADELTPELREQIRHLWSTADRLQRGISGLEHESR